jgi:hypothetical protein
MNIDQCVETKPCQRQAIALKQQVRKIVPRRPNQWLKGTVSQQPMKAQQRYGAELMRPTSQVSLDWLPAIPNWYLYQICAPLTTVSSVFVNGRTG